MAVGTYVHRRVAAAPPDEHQTSFMTDQELFVALLLLLSIFAPPIAVFLERGLGLDFLLNLLLTILGFLPGLLHALFLINESSIHYSPSSYASPPPSKGSLTFHEVLRAASDEEREEKAKLAAREKRRGPASSVGSGASDGDLDGEDAELEKVEAGLTRAPTYRSTATGPPPYVHDAEEAAVPRDSASREDEDRWAAEAEMSEKRRGKRREDPSQWV
ncbi:hypothetical protein JCM6882_006091 [Rhodosporidiobolus microsporus]